jgi:hypothetical protein
MEGTAFCLATLLMMRPLPCPSSLHGAHPAPVQLPRFKQNNAAGWPQHALQVRSQTHARAALPTHLAWGPSALLRPTLPGSFPQYS